MKKVLKYLRLAGILLAGLIILAELCIIGLYTLGGYGTASKLPVFVTEISSDSMYPELRAGECILGVVVPFSSIQEGDTITYAYNGSWITHRVVRCNEDGSVTTKGLANSYEDGSITQREYVGKMLFKMPLHSTFLKLTESWAGKLIWILLVVLLCFGYPMGMWLLNRLSVPKYRGKWLKNCFYQKKYKGKWLENRSGRLHLQLQQELEELTDWTELLDQDQIELDDP